MAEDFLDIMGQCLRPLSLEQGVRNLIPSRPHFSVGLLVLRVSS